MQPARIKLHAKEHTNNPVQRPNFRGQGATKLRDNEMEALKRFPTKGLRKNDTTLKAVRGECRRHPPRPRGQERGAGRGTRVWKGSRQQAGVSTSRGVVINPDPTPVVKLKIPKKPGPQKSLQEVAAARATENLRRDKKGKVREQVDLFVVAQKAQVVLCDHKKGRQKENL